MKRNSRRQSRNAARTTMEKQVKMTTSPPRRTTARLTTPRKAGRNDFQQGPPVYGQPSMPRCFAVVVSYPHYIARAPNVRNAGKPRVQSLASGRPADLVQRLA